MPAKKTPAEKTAPHRITFVREEVTAMVSKWSLMRAALEGEEAVKALGRKVLPQPNPEDESKENLARYDAYLLRAVFFPVTGRTTAGLTGYAFSNPPLVELPDSLKLLEANADGGGVTLNQQAEEALRRILTLGRAGVLADFPTLDRPVSRADLQKGRVRPTLQLYEPEQIIDWEIDFNGAEKILKRLVLQETVEKRDPVLGGIQRLKRWRELTLTVEGYSQQLFTEGEAGKTESLEEGTPVLVKGQDGKPLDRIPFQFLGARNNDETLDTAPLQDMMWLNFAHFRNSADFEESCFICGQPTPVFTGLTESWVRENMGGKVLLGSRKAVPLPKDATAELLQADPNNLPKEAMEIKEKQMLSLGARLVESGAVVQRTATEATNEHISDVSVLSTATNNVVTGMRQALRYAALFVPASPDEIRYELAEPLARKNMSPEQANAVAQSWLSGVLSFTEARHSFRLAGMAFQPDAVALKEIGADPLRKKAALEKKQTSSGKKPEPQQG